MNNFNNLILLITDLSDKELTNAWHLNTRKYANFMQQGNIYLSHTVSLKASVNGFM